MYATGNEQTGGKAWLEKGTLPGMRDALLAENFGGSGLLGFSTHGLMSGTR